MPYPNEHSCRLQPPGKYDRFRREPNFQGSGYDVIWGIRTEDGKQVTEMQAIRYPKDKWPEARARKHCDDKDGSFEAAAKMLTLSEAQRELITELIKQGHKLKEIMDKFLVVEEITDLQEQIRTAEVWDCTDPEHPVLIQLMKRLKKILRRKEKK